MALIISRLLSKGEHGSLTCATNLVCAVHKKARQALMSLHKCWLRKTEKQSFFLVIITPSKVPQLLLNWQAWLWSMKDGVQVTKKRKRQREWGRCWTVTCVFIKHNNNKNHGHQILSPLLWLSSSFLTNPSAMGFRSIINLHTHTHTHTHMLKHTHTSVTLNALTLQSCTSLNLNCKNWNGIKMRDWQMSICIDPEASPHPSSRIHHPPAAALAQVSASWIQTVWSSANG